MDQQNYLELKKLKSLPKQFHFKILKLISMKVKKVIMNLNMNLLFI